MYDIKPHISEKTLPFLSDYDVYSIMFLRLLIALFSAFLETGRKVFSGEDAAYTYPCASVAY